MTSDHWLLPDGDGGRVATPELVKQPVLDAAAVLQLRRSELAASPDAEVLAVGDQMNPFLRQWALEWTDLLSIRPSVTAQELRVNLRLNRDLLAGPPRKTMISVFNYEGMDLDARMLLANEAGGYYRFGFGPVQLKIVDQQVVLLPGPVVDGDPSIMGVRSGPCFEAAWAYWDAVLATALPAAEVEPGLGALSARQRQVVVMLADDLGDEAIAEALGVSVRTVRSDIAAVLTQLGVKSRFAAGIRLRLESSTLG